MADHSAALAARIDEIYRQLEHQSPPLGSFRRLWSIGGLQLSLLSHYAKDWVRRHFNAHSEAERLEAEAHLEAALRILATMGYLRGLVMKIGQALSHYPGALHPQISSILESLQFEAPPMHFSLVREQVIDELGADPRDLFAHFEEKAFRAASLGQVHRARLKTGEWVAMKIQYPGIARTIESDLKNLRTILGTAKLFTTWQTFDALMEDLVATFTREVDYMEEARNQVRAAALFDGSDGIVVPRVHEKLSSARILTTDFLEGVHLGEYLASNPSPAARSVASAKLWRVVARMLMSGGQIHADVHPGNFLFHPDGTIGLLDFGNVRHLSAEENSLFRRAWMTTLHGTDEEVLEITKEIAGVHPPIEFVPAQTTLILGMARWLRRTIVTDGEFAIDELYLKEVLDIFRESGKLAEGPPQPPEMMSMIFHSSRSSAGLASMLFRLGARTNFHRIHEDEMVRGGFSRR